MQERIRERLTELLKADRWVEGKYSAIAPATPEEVLTLLRHYPGSILTVGGGTSFPNDFNPGPEALIMLTFRLVDLFDISFPDQVLDVSAGHSIKSVNQRLETEGLYVPALKRFNAGTIGGRLGLHSSHPSTKHGSGWVQSLLGIEIALPSGKSAMFGSRCIKDVAGYDLRHVFTGSRGHAGIILKALFRCRPLTEFHEDDLATMTEDLKPAGRLDPKWKRLFDPLGRMFPGG